MQQESGRIGVSVFLCALTTLAICGKMQSGHYAHLRRTILAFKKFKADKVNPDGIYAAGEDEMKFNDFNSESEMQRFIVDNISDFCENVLGDELIAYDCERGFGKYTGAFAGKRQYRIDIYITGKSHNYIIEMKNPKSHCDCRDAIGQLLVYSSYFSDCVMVLVTSKYDSDVARAIEKFKLPIRYVCLSKSISAEVVRHDANWKT